ncbi:MAG: hypothetical protein L0Y75_06110 [Acidobacteria bacterium]|nr:hypothetical protein [Acidobacteriota bacterium]
MTDDDTTNNSNGHQIAQLIATIRSLEDRFTAVEISVTEVKTRLASVEEVIVARLSNTRPFDQEVLARLNELVTIVTAIREEQVAMREELTALRIDHERFREETNHNFKLVNQMLAHLNNDFLRVRAEHTLLEERVSRLEEAA